MIVLHKIKILCPIEIQSAADTRTSGISQKLSMMTKKTKKTILWTLLGVLFLAISLFLHIVWVTWPSDEYHAEMQLGRIDFDHALSETQGKEAIEAMHAVEGITIVKLNQDRTSLIYGMPTGAKPLQEVFQSFQSSIAFAGHPVIPEVSGNGGVCPVMNKKSLVYRVSVFIQNSFS